MESRKRVNQPVKQDENKVKRVKKTMNVLFGDQGAPAATTSEEDTATIHTSSTSQTAEHTPDHAGSNRVNLADTLPVVTGPGVNSTSTTRKRLKRILGSGVLGTVTNALGPIKQVAEIFVECVDAYKVGDKTKVEYEELIARLEALFEDLVGYFEDGCSQPMTASMRRLCKSIREELESVQDKKGRSIGARYLQANHGIDEILAHYRRAEGYLERLSLNANLSMWKITHEQAASYQSDRMSSLIDRLPSVLSARYNSAEGEALKRRECTPGTRVQEIAMVLGWVRNRGDGAVYWLNGMAGTGKTTIAYSTCAALDSAHMLGASFFCSRLRDECRNVNMIIPSIAYQLARFSRPFHHALCNALENDPDAHGKQLLMQFNTLIKEPILHIQHTLPEELIVVIDALDECENKESTKQILNVLLRESTRLPIRFVLSSRPEPEIRDQMSEPVRSRLVLHELDKGKVQVDIETYLRAELSQMSPSEEQIAGLVDKAGILFIYAATAVRYIGYDNFQSDPHDRLRTILATSESQEDRENEEIDQLYTTVLDAALGNRRLRKAERDNMQQVLHTVICARDPLTVSELSELLRIHDIGRVRAVLRPLWSILHVVGESELVTTLHASFPDFMFDSTRSKAYHCDSEAHNCILAEHCLDRIKRVQPQLNICNLESSHIPDDMVPNIEERVANIILPDLLYACKYWAEHVRAGKCAPSLAVQLQAFLSTRLLLWMEVLNLNKQMWTGVECMKLAVEWCSQLKDDEKLVELVKDTQRFVNMFASNPVSQSTPHIYVSMMKFWPRSAPLAMYYAHFTHGPVEAEGTALEQRQPAHLATWVFDEVVRAIAVSPDGRCIALGIGTDVSVVNSSGGQIVLGPLCGHTQRIRSIMFSPDQTRVLAGSFTPRTATTATATVIVWDTRTGDTIVGPLQLDGHLGTILSLAFSSDCTRMVTSSLDNTLRLWDTENGHMLRCFETPRVPYAAAFSPNGIDIAVGCDEALQVWNSLTGATILGPLSTRGINMIAFSPDKSCIIHARWYSTTVYVRDAQSGHLIRELNIKNDYGIQSIGYSPDGKYIVSGHNPTVQVWDAQNGNIKPGPLLLEGHANRISSVAFASDGSRIISACLDGLVCTWDARQLNLEPRSIGTRFGCIRSVKFSPDGMHFVSRSKDDSLHIWDSHTGTIIVGPIKVHTAMIIGVDFLNGCVVTGFTDGMVIMWNAWSGEVLRSLTIAAGHRIRNIAFSMNGQLIATGSESFPSPEVNLWHAYTGTWVIGPLTGLSIFIWSIQFSPDSTRIVASSEHPGGQMVVWNVSTGKAMSGFLKGHTSTIQSVSYSPNGALIASGSNDKTIIVWDAYTGSKLLGPLVGHSENVISVNFSPDSTRLLSSSHDRTVRLWDVRTGLVIFELLHGHTHIVRSVAYSPDGTRILSRCDDTSVRITDGRITEERALSHSINEYGDWTINKDGWIVDDQSRLLVWVPGDLRRALMWPRTQVAVAPWGYVRVKFDKSRMGESWAQSYT